MRSRHVGETLADCLLVIAPRHPERFGKVYNLCRRRGLDVVRHTDAAGAATRDTNIYLLDTLGELPLFYACADVAFIGGSLVPAGGHNVLEAARLGVPLISGKHTGNFAEITGLFKAADAITIVTDCAQLAAAVIRLLQDDELRQSCGERGQRLVRQESRSDRFGHGITGRIFVIFGIFGVRVKILTRTGAPCRIIRIFTLTPNIYSDPKYPFLFLSLTIRNNRSISNSADIPACQQEVNGVAGTGLPGLGCTHMYQPPVPTACG